MLDEINGVLISEKITELENGDYILNQLYENKIPSKTRAGVYNTSGIFEVMLCNGDGSIIWKMII